MYVLDVFYDADASEPLEVQLGRRDADAEKTVGHLSVGGGFDKATWRRDLVFEFDSEAKLKTAKKRLYYAGFRFAERLR